MWCNTAWTRSAKPKYLDYLWCQIFYVECVKSQESFVSWQPKSLQRDSNASRLRPNSQDPSVFFLWVLSTSTEKWISLLIRDWLIIKSIYAFHKLDNMFMIISTERGQDLLCNSWNPMSFNIMKLTTVFVDTDLARGRFWCAVTFAAVVR